MNTHNTRARIRTHMHARMQLPAHFLAHP